MSTLDALQATLPAEHAALHLYGLYGGRTSQAAAPRPLRRPCRTATARTGRAGTGCGW